MSELRILILSLIIVGFALFFALAATQPTPSVAPSAREVPASTEPAPTSTNEQARWNLISLTVKRMKLEGATPEEISNYIDQASR